MSESSDASTSNEEVWDYIEQNPKIIGLPLTNTKGIDLLSALRDVYIQTKKNPEIGMNLLTILANFLVAAAQGEAEEFIEEVTVLDLMSDLDVELKKVLDEGH
jgi:hypothetical protein